MFADELAKMELKFKEQLKMNENMKLQLASEEDRYKVSLDPKHCGRAICCKRCAAGAGAFKSGLPLDTYCVFTAGMAGLALGRSL